MLRTRWILSSIAFVATCAGGCDDKLNKAIDDLRAEMPNACKDYCEDKVDCEWPVTVVSDLEKDARSVRIQRCEVACAVDMGRGVYVATNAVDGVDYVDRVSGGELEDALACAIGNELYRCLNYVHTFDGPVQSQCAEAETCLSELGIDRHLDWTTDANGVGTCTLSGSQWLDNEMF